MKIIHKILNLIFPITCRICGKRSETTICDECKEVFLRETFEHCRFCGLTALNCSCNNDFARHTRTEIDGKCSIALSFYKPGSCGDRLTERMLFDLKDKGEFACFFAEELARLIKIQFIKSGLDVSEWAVTYIPRSSENIYRKGFDQGEEVARRLAKILGVKFIKTFKRTDFGTAQKSLTSKERKENAENTIVPIRNNISKCKNYLLFDDIITTGATVETAAKHLYFCGAEAVFPVLIAKTRSEFIKNNI